MVALDIDIRLADPTDTVFEELFDRHLTLMYASSPSCSVHAKPASGLSGEGVTFLAGFYAGEPVAMGAVQDLGDAHFEIKSMHVVEKCRGRGIAQDILASLLDAASENGAKRISLETGSQPAFAPARAFYASAGFEACAPFADYTDDPNSYYMTRSV